MNNKLETFKENIKNKRVAVIGIGISNLPALQFLTKLGAKVFALDKRENLDIDLDELKENQIQFILGNNYLDNLSNYDYILRSPGVKPFTPEIEEAVKNGVILTSEIELVMELAPCKIIGITGSDGKTTTTTLVSKFLEQAGHKVWLGGNIGTPLFNKLEEMGENDIVVLELSSFQLMTMKKSPDISIITNISPNHLDYHRSYDEYIEAKTNIFKFQKNKIVVFNINDDMTKKFEMILDNTNSNNELRYFSTTPMKCKGCYFNGNSICYFDGKKNIHIQDKKDIKLVGIHNIANICAAITAIIDFVKVSDIQYVLTTFNGVKHRMEHIATINNVKWYNDSIGTSPSRTLAGLNSFDQKIILIAGGYDKNIPYSSLGKPILEKVKNLVLLGATAPKIEEAVTSAAKKEGKKIENILTISNFSCLEDCVNYCHSIAKPGDIVVMSPASASFDLYKNFEQRGEHFIKLVNILKD